MRISLFSFFFCMINYVIAGSDVKQADFDRIPYPQSGFEVPLIHGSAPGFAAYYATPPQNQHFYVSVYPLQLCSSVVVRVSDKKFEPPYKFDTATFKDLQVVYNPMKREILITDGANELLKGFWDKPYISFFYNAAAKKYELTTLTAYTGKEDADEKAIKRTPIDMGKSMIVTTSGRYCRTLVNYVGNDKWVHIGDQHFTEYSQAPVPAGPKVDPLPAVTNLLKKSIADKTPGASNCLKSTSNAQFTRFLSDTVWQTKDTEFKVQKLKIYLTNVTKSQLSSLKLMVGNKCDFVKIQFGDTVDPTFQLDLFPSASFFVPPHTSEGHELHVNGKNIPFYRIDFGNSDFKEFTYLSYFATGPSTYAFTESFKLPFKVLEELNLKNGMNIHVVYSPQCEAAIIEDVPAPLAGSSTSQWVRIKSCTSHFVPSV